MLALVAAIVPAYPYEVIAMHALENRSELPIVTFLGPDHVGSASANGVGYEVLPVRPRVRSVRRRTVPQIERHDPEIHRLGPYSSANRLPVNWNANPKYGTAWLTSSPVRY